MAATSKTLEFREGDLNHRELLRELVDKEAEAEKRRVSRELGWSARELLEMALPEPRWLIKNWVAEGLNMLVSGQPKTFKSTVLMEIAFTLATDNPLFGDEQFPLENSPTPVVYLHEENTMQDTRRQLMDMAVRQEYGSRKTFQYTDDRGRGQLFTDFTYSSDDDLPLYVFNRRGWTATEENLEWLAKVVEEVGAGWVFIDPLYKVMPGGSLSDDDAISPLTRGLDAFTEETGANIALLHHQNKNRDAKGGQRVLGSNLLWAWGAQTMWLSRYKTTEIWNQKTDTHQKIYKLKVESDTRSIEVPIGEAKLEYFGKGKWLWTPWADEDSKGGSPSRPNKEQFLIDYKEGRLEGLTRAEIGSKYGVVDKTVTNWRKEATLAEEPEVI